jgi:hypothetical protein
LAAAAAAAAAAAPSDAATTRCEHVRNATTIVSRCQHSVGDTTTGSGGLA